MKIGGNWTLSQHVKHNRVDRFLYRDCVGCWKLWLTILQAFYGVDTHQPWNELRKYYP